MLRIIRLGLGHSTFSRVFKYRSLHRPSYEFVFSGTENGLRWILFCSFSRTYGGGGVSFANNHVFRICDWNNTYTGYINSPYIFNDS